jgi:hypothetical protein
MGQRKNARANRPPPHLARRHISPAKSSKLRHSFLHLESHPQGHLENALGVRYRRQSPVIGGGDLTECVVIDIRVGIGEFGVVEDG